MIFKKLFEEALELKATNSGDLNILRIDKSPVQASDPKSVKMKSIRTAISY